MEKFVVDLRDLKGAKTKVCSKKEKDKESSCYVYLSCYSSNEGRKSLTCERVPDAHFGEAISSESLNNFRR